MTRKRVSGAERRTLILNAARRVFARCGYEGAKTLDIAREAQVSEALVYRHFPSKLSLYRTVLRHAFREQDANWTTLGIQQKGAEGLVKTLIAYFTAIVNEPDAEAQVGFRLTLSSLSADGYFASLIYRRSQRLYAKAVQAAYDEARAAGDIVGEPIAVANITMFHEHIGTMLNAVHALGLQKTPYANSGDDLVRDAVRFCARGMGLSEAATNRYLNG